MRTRLVGLVSRFSRYGKCAISHSAYSWGILEGFLVPPVEPDGEFALWESRRFVGVGAPGHREQRDGIARALDRYLDQPGRRSAGRAGGAGEAEPTGAAFARTRG